MIRKFVLSSLFVFSALIFGAWYLSDEYIYVPIYIDFEGQVEKSDVSLELKGETPGVALSSYSGSYSKYVDFYLEFVDVVEAGKLLEAKSMMLPVERERFDSQAQILKDGSNIWSSEDLVAILEYKNKVVGLVEYEIPGARIKPFRLFTIATEGDELLLDISGDFDYVESELINSGFYSREAAGEYDFGSNLERIKAGFANFLTRGENSQWKFDGVTVVSFRNAGLTEEAELIVKFIENASTTSVEGALQKIAVSPDSRQRVYEWLKTSGVSASEVGLNSIFGGSMKFDRSYAVGADCQVLYFTSESRNSVKPLYICERSDEIFLSNIFYESSFNRFFDYSVFEAGIIK